MRSSSANAFDPSTMPFRKVAFILWLTVFAAAAGVCAAADAPKQIQLSAQLNEELIYLLSLADPELETPDQFEPGRIGALLAFVLADKPEDHLYTPADIRSAPGAYMEGRFAVSLKRVLALAYNPRIPAVFTSPTSMRASQWRKVNGQQQSLPDLQHMLDDLQRPVILTGIEYIQNTPDTFSGAYYDYELDRAIILFKQANHSLLISVSSQMGKSGVGKKGIILGQDRNLDYVYTGNPGLNMTGLGWVKSYMYDSYAVAIYCETETESPTVKAGFFKWVRAGWANLNLVRPDHIYSGLKRFVPIYKSILERSNAADIMTIERIWKSLNSLSDKQLRQATSGHFKKMARYHTDASVSDGRIIDNTLLNPDYINNLDRLEMQSVLLIEYVKKLLGMEFYTDVGSLPFD
jgi:hypothetical protein